jgi:hypothetical protein
LIGCDQAPLRGQQPKASGSAGGSLLNDVERRLISDYVERRLSEQEKVAFERNYLVTNERREQLAIAQALSEMEHAVPGEAHGQRVLGYERRNVSRRFLDWMGAPGPIVGFAAAAITVVRLSANVVLFLMWRDQAHQTAVVSDQLRTLQAPKEKHAPNNRDGSCRRHSGT